MTSRIKINGALACDDFRQEIGGKVSLLGIVGPHIAVPHLPGSVRIAFGLLFDAIEEGEVALKVRLKGPGTGVVAEMTLQFEIVGVGNGLIAGIPPVSLLLSQPGTLRLEYQEEGGRWRRIQQWKIDLIQAAVPPRPKTRKPSRSKSS